MYHFKRINDFEKNQLDQVINNIIENDELRRPLRAKSLIATIFGDFIEPYGGKIWLTNLITLVQQFEINERLLRTSVFRLIEEGWLIKTREGRRSIYGLSEDGIEQTLLAAELLYHYKKRSWNGIWLFVIATSKNISAEKNIQLCHRLSLMGFEVLSKNIFAHPDMDNNLVKKVVAELGLQKQVMIMQSQNIESVNMIDEHTNDQELVKQCCSYKDAEAMYNHFIIAYKPIIGVLKKTQRVTGDISFRLRVLLMHDYRRLLFKDPQLPVELLPGDWSGDKARALVKEIYLLTYKSANNFYLSICKDDVLKPKLKKAFYSRFGGF